MARIISSTKVVIVDYEGATDAPWSKRAFAKASFQEVSYSTDVVAVTFANGTKIDFTYQTFGTQFASNQALFDWLMDAADNQF